MGARPASRYNPRALSSERHRISRLAHDAPANSRDSSPERPPRKTTVVLGIVAACALFAAVTIFLFYRSMRHAEPSHVAVVRGSAAWNGAKLTVSGGSLRQPMEAMLDESGRYTVPFFVGPGSYTLIAQVDGREVHRADFTLGDEKSLFVELPDAGPAPSVSPATGP